MRKLSYKQTIAIGFAVLILAGAILLTLPIASKSHEATPFMDALFTATSAGCVTGLVVYDTYTYWSLFGQLVILILIQVGGIGFMMVATLFALLLRKRIGLTHRGLIQESSNTLQIGGVVQLARYVITGTLFIEAIGAFFLAFRFCPEFGFVKGIYFSIFHSVSAFCNAGFDLMGSIEPSSSVTSFSDDTLVNFVLMALIILGGVGFFVWKDVFHHKLKWRYYALHTKIVLSTTLALIVIPTLLIFILEGGSDFVNDSTADSLLASMFQAVSPRTAGFNSVDLTLLSSASLLLVIFLMIVGGSPGSTAGGLKTTTLFTVIMSTLATIKNKQDISVFKRRLNESILKRAVAITGIYMLVAMFAIFTISSIQDFPMEEIVFEVFSAIGTVGMTLGITPDLSTIPQLIIMFLMFFGRIGVLTIALSFVHAEPYVPVRYPEEKIMIG